MIMEGECRSVQYVAKLNEIASFSSVPRSERPDWSRGSLFEVVEKVSEQFLLWMYSP
jgi:hypothetical protein